MDNLKTQETLGARQSTKTNKRIKFSPVHNQLQ